MIDHHARVIRASYEPSQSPAFTEVLVRIKGEVDVSYNDHVTLSVNEGEVK